MRYYEVMYQIKNVTTQPYPEYNVYATILLQAEGFDDAIKRSEEFVPKGLCKEIIYTGIKEF